MEVDMQNAPSDEVKPTLLQQVRDRLRARLLSIRTEQAYVPWIERFLRFQKLRSGEWRHPREMGSDEINQFLTSLAVDRHVAASTQNQALSALLFLYREVVDDKALVIDAVRAQRPQRLPVVLSQHEVGGDRVEVRGEVAVACSVPRLAAETRNTTPHLRPLLPEAG
jgi:site-specific recombinase XerD